MTQPYRRGDVVEVFYRMGRDDGSYFPVSSQYACTLRPRFGRSDGWMTARVEDDWPATTNGNSSNQNNAAAQNRVRIRHTHVFWSNRRGERLDPYDDRDMVVFMSPADVRHPASPTWAPALSLFPPSRGPLQPCRHPSPFIRRHIIHAFVAEA